MELPANKGTVAEGSSVVKSRRGGVERFWEQKYLSEMTRAEWEALCDGCGKCCLVKLQDEETADIVYTNVACSQLDEKTCRCKNYEKRFRVEPDCINLASLDHEQLLMMPPSCAYRRLAEGKSLPDWHPLISNDELSTKRAGQSVSGKIVYGEFSITELEDYVVNWPLELHFENLS
jgi:uncharacterized cysteine cluster protein YcgN (CxxCxxCC family)